MFRFRLRRSVQGFRFISRAACLLKDSQGSALLEFAISVPLLVVFIVGIYDFSGALNQRQKIAQAAQEGAIVAGAQPMSDIQTNPTGPQSLLPVVTAVFNSLVSSGVVPGGACGPPGTVTAPGTLTWMYQISGCSTANGGGDLLTITINRGCVCGGQCALTCTLGTGTTYSVGTVVKVQYPYHWRFGSAIQLLFPGPNGYLTPTQLTESASVHNQM
jgi:TadE-like protein